MNTLPDNFLRPAGDTAKRSANRPAPFSADDFSVEAIEEGSQAYVQHVEQHPPPLIIQAETQPEAATISQSKTADVPEPTPRQTKLAPTRRATAKRATIASVGDEKANIRLEIASGIRKDMIKIKHKVGIAHGVEVSYAAYFMFLHERCRNEHHSSSFLADLAQFTEQLKHT